MTPKEFAECFTALQIPLTEEEWSGLTKLLEEIAPGITVWLSKGIN